MVIRIVALVARLSAPGLHSRLESALALSCAITAPVVVAKSGGAKSTCWVGVIVSCAAVTLGASESSVTHAASVQLRRSVSVAGGSV